MAIHFAHPYFGYPRMMTALWEAGYRVNHKKVWRLMKELSIQSVIRKKRKRSSSTPSVVYPNRLKRQFHAVGPQQKLVTDITYISDGTRFYYLSAIQDLFNNEVVAWQLSERNDVKLVLDTIEQWTRKRNVYWKPCSIQIRASSTRLRPTTHDWKHSASKAATLAKQPAWITPASNPSFRISRQRSCIFTSVRQKLRFIKL